MEQVKIRLARPEDALKLIRLLIPEFEQRSDEQLRQVTYFRQWKLVFDQMTQSPALRVFLAERDGELLGVTTAYLLPRLELAGLYSILEDVFVKERERAKGIGTLIFQEVLSFLRKENVHHVTLGVARDNLMAQRFYEGLGFKSEDGLGMTLSLKTVQ